MKCKFCQKEYEIKGLKNHLRSYVKEGKINKEQLESAYWEHFFSNEECENILKRYIKEQEGIYNIAKVYNKDGVFIKRFLLYKGIKLRTNSEAKKTKSYIKKYTTTIIKKYGVDNISKNQGIKEKKKQTFFKNFGYENNFCNTETNKKAHENIDYSKCWESCKKTLKEKYNVENWINIPGVLENIDWDKRNEKQIKTLLKKHGVTNAYQIPYVKERIKNSYVSKQELKIQDILNKLEITYCSNIWIKGINVDVYIPSKNLIIEINGDYWHANPEQYKPTDLIRGKLVENIWKKDEEQKNKLLKNGYNHLTIWEKDINENLKDLETFILNILSNKN